MNKYNPPRYSKIKMPKQLPQKSKNVYFFSFYRKSKSTNITMTYDYGEIERICQGLDGTLASILSLSV